MKNILFILSLIISTIITAQNYNIPYRQDNLWGYADKTGKVIITPKYDSVETWNENIRWLVFKNNKVGVINDSGREVLSVEYDAIERCPVHSQYNEFYVVKNGKEGFTDMDGNFILPAKYEMLQKCRDLPMNKDYYFFAIEKPDTLTLKLIDYKQRVLLSNIAHADNFYKGKFVFKIKNKYGLYDVPNEKWILEATYDSIKYLNYDYPYQLKPEFKDYKYYAARHDTLFLITQNMQIKAFAKKKTAYFLERYDEASKSEYMIGEELASSVKGKFISVTGKNFIENNGYETDATGYGYNYYSSSKKNEVKTITILKDKNR